MRYFLYLIFGLIITHSAFAKTERIAQFNNDQVNVWETTIYPGTDNKLSMHRHEYNRVLIALDEGTLKVVNNKNETHLLKLEKNKAYFLKKDEAGEEHIDVNITEHPIRVMVIELRE